jgi:hypothetical protein
VLEGEAPVAAALAELKAMAAGSRRPAARAAEGARDAAAQR